METQKVGAAVVLLWGGVWGLGSRTSTYAPRCLLVRERIGATLVVARLGDRNGLHVVAHRYPTSNKNMTWQIWQVPRLGDPLLFGHFGFQLVGWFSRVIYSIYTLTVPN